MKVNRRNFLQVSTIGASAAACGCRSREPEVAVAPEETSSAAPMDSSRESRVSREEMAESGCERCSLRAKYDDNPESFLGRLWRWHIDFCPGWEKYMESVPGEKRLELARQYQIEKYL